MYVEDGVFAGKRAGGAVSGMSGWWALQHLPHFLTRNLI